MTWNIGGNLGIGYTPPLSPDIGGDVFPPASTLYPSGWVSATTSTPLVTHWIQLVVPTGWRSSVFGTPAIPVIAPLWWRSSVVGMPGITNRVRFVTPGGIPPPPQSGPDSARQIPTPKIADRRQRLQPTSIAAPTFPTTHVVTHEIQFVYLAGRGISPPTISAPRIDFTVRYIAPPFIVSMVFGRPTVARPQSLAPTGWSSSSISDDHDLQINLQRLFPQSGITDPATYGQAAVRNAWERIRPRGWSSSEINFATIRNRTQQVFVSPADATGPSTQWPSFGPYIQNRNRVLRTSGWQSSRISVLANDIRNVAQIVAPSGFVVTLWGGGTFVAHRNRSVSPQGWVGARVGAYTVVYTNTQWLYPRAWVNAFVGHPESVRNRNRLIKHAYPYDGSSAGQPTVSFRIRTLSPSGIPRGRVGIPEVRFDPYPIAPNSIHDPRQFGRPHVEERFTIVRPRSVNVFSTPRVGTPTIVNRNRTFVVGFGRPSSEFGRQVVENRNRYIGVGFGDLLKVGAPRIEHRTKVVRPAPFSVPKFPHLHRIRNLIPDPPGPQYVVVGGFSGFVFGEVALNRRSIHPVGFTTTALGIPAITVSEIRPQSIVDLDQVGRPTLVVTQFLYPRDIAPTSDAIEVNTVRHQMSPHAIYAPSGEQASAQSKRIHQERPLHVIDGLLFTETNPQVPAPTISLAQARLLEPNSWRSSTFGTADLMLRHRVVRPSSIRSFRSGLPVFLNVPQTISLVEEGGFLSEAIGAHEIAYAYVRRMPAPEGFQSSEFGTQRIELFNRIVSPTGIPHRGNPQQGFTSPWGEAMIGTRRWFEFQGFDATRFGTTRVEFRIRRFPMQGWDSFADAQRDLTPRPRDRMQVRRVGPSGRPNIILFVSSIYRETPSGIASGSVFGNPSIAPYIQHIGARGFRRDRFGQVFVGAV